MGSGRPDPEPLINRPKYMSMGNLHLGSFSLCLWLLSILQSKEYPFDVFLLKVIVSSWLKEPKAIYLDTFSPGPAQILLKQTFYIAAWIKILDLSCDLVFYWRYLLTFEDASADFIYSKGTFSFRLIYCWKPKMLLYDSISVRRKRRTS